jgi:hypothetical protein
MAVPRFNRDREEKKAEEKLRSFFARQKEAWDRRLQEVDFRPDKVGKRFLTEQEQELAILLLLLSSDPLNASLGIEYRKARSAIQRAGLGEAVVREKMADRAFRAAQARAKQMAKQIVSDTDRRLRRAGAEDLRDRDLRSDRYQTLFGGTRAESISITATTGAKSLGIRTSEEVLQAEDIRTFTKWRTKRDDRVCPICDPLDGTPPHVWEGQFPDGPPAHPRCRCDLEVDYG